MIPSTRIIEEFLAVTVTAAALIVSGCAGGTSGSIDRGGFLAALDLPLEDFSEVPEARRPEANRIQYVHDVRFAFGAPQLSAGERRRLDAFLARAGVGYGDRIHVVAGRPPAAGNADARSRLAERRRETVSAFLALRLLEAEPLLSDFAAEPPLTSMVRVIVRRYVVTLPGCPDWSGRPGQTYNNQVSSNFGCASAVNLGLMVANPGDLEAGRRLEPADGEFMARTIERYRKGETKPLTPEDIGVIESQQKSGEGE